MHHVWSTKVSGSRSVHCVRPRTLFYHLPAPFLRSGPSEPTTSSPTTPIAVLAAILGKSIKMERFAVPEGSLRARKSRDNRYGCAGIVCRSGSQALGATVGCTCSMYAVLPACVLCLCERSVCLCAGFWRWEQRIACKEPRSVCDLQTLRRGLSSH